MSPPTPSETANPLTGRRTHGAQSGQSLPTAAVFRPAHGRGRGASARADPASYTVSLVDGGRYGRQHPALCLRPCPRVTQASTITADVSAAPVDSWAFSLSRAVAFRRTTGPPPPNAGLVNPMMALPVAARARTGAAPAGMNEIRILTCAHLPAPTQSPGCGPSLTTPTLVKLYVGSTEVVTGTIAGTRPTTTPDVNAGGIYTQLITIADRQRRWRCRLRHHGSRPRPLCGLRRRWQRPAEPTRCSARAPPLPPANCANSQSQAPGSSGSCCKPRRVPAPRSIHLP